MLILFEETGDLDRWIDCREVERNIRVVEEGIEKERGEKKKKKRREEVLKRRRNVCWQTFNWWECRLLILSITRQIKKERKKSEHARWEDFRHFYESSYSQENERKKEKRTKKKRRWEFPRSRRRNLKTTRYLGDEVYIHQRKSVRKKPISESWGRDRWRSRVDRRWKMNDFLLAIHKKSTDLPERKKKEFFSSLKILQAISWVEKFLLSSLQARESTYPTETEKRKKERQRKE